MGIYLYKEYRCDDNPNIIVMYLDNDECRLVGYEGDEEDVSVPEYVAVKGSILRIVSVGMSWCKKRKLTLPESVAEIRDLGFSKLEELVLPSSVKFIQKGAFRQSDNLKRVVLPESLTAIPEEAFERCNKLESIVLPSNLTSIGYSAFRDCTSLKEVFFSETLATIGNYAFAGCSSLKKVVLPESLANIGDNAFERSGIESVVMPDTLKEIGQSAFSYCGSLKKIRIPLGLDEIKENVFDNSALESVNLLNVKKVSGWAFGNCKNLKDVIMPLTVEIGNHAFFGCDNLERVFAPNLGTIEDGAFGKCEKLRVVESTQKLIKIAGSAFDCCLSLSRITMSGNVDLEDGTFRDTQTNILELYGKKLNTPKYNCQKSGHEKLLIRKPKLRLFVYLSNDCNAFCEFCSNAKYRHQSGKFDLKVFEETLLYLKERDVLKGVSFTGGEPTMNMPLLNEAVNTVYKALGEDVEVAISTNGYALMDMLSMDSVSLLESIHLSRHHFSDVQNNTIFHQQMCTTDDIRLFQESIEDKNTLVLNCNLIKGKIDSVDRAKKFMDWASSLDIKKCAFVTLMPFNPFCKAHVVKSQDLFYEAHPDMLRIRDFKCDWCSCLDGYYYSTDNNMMAYYVRQVTNTSPDIVSRLIYTSDNHLKTGFGPESTILF
ncbi:MAG: leucine-rich repeat protein [Paludibacteraceae bacterium]|nr:leucine-rich repeat protein [Paludibacteraceae bacterium]